MVNYAYHLPLPLKQMFHIGKDLGLFWQCIQVPMLVSVFNKCLLKE